jgi:hypothetical protein
MSAVREALERGRALGARDEREAAQRATTGSLRIEYTDGSTEETRLLPKELGSHLFTAAEIAIANADGRLRVDKDGLGWIRDMKPARRPGGQGK